MTQHPAHAQNHRHPDEPRPDEIARAIKGGQYPATSERRVLFAMLIRSSFSLVGVG